jgi:hypothetical protein
MRVYTVHTRPLSAEPDRDAVLVKEGFCWPAFFFSVLWALGHRMWFTAIGFLLAVVGAEAAALFLGLDPVTDFALGLGVAAAIGYVANDCRRAALRRRGFVAAGIAAAAGTEAALRRWFDLNPPADDRPAAGFGAAFDARIPGGAAGSA